MSGIRFPDDMVGKSGTMNENDKVLISDSQADKEAKWWSLASIRNWFASFFANINGSNLASPNLEAFQEKLQIALLSGSIKEVPNNDVFTINENGFYATVDGDSNLPTGANKDGFLKCIKHNNNHRYLVYNTWEGGALHFWAAYYNGSTWSAWALTGAGGSGGSTFKVTAADTTPGFLTNKLIMGSGMYANVLNSGENEQYEIRSVVESKISSKYDIAPDLIMGSSYRDSVVHNIQFTAEEYSELKGLGLRFHPSFVELDSLIIDVYDHAIASGEVLGTKADTLLTGFSKRYTGYNLEAGDTDKYFEFDEIFKLNKDQEYSILIYSGYDAYEDKDQIRLLNYVASPVIPNRMIVLDGSDNIVGYTDENTPSPFFRLTAENKIETKGNGFIEIAGRNLTYNGVPFVPVVLGKASVQDASNIEKTSTSYVDCGIELNYTPKLVGSQLEVSIDGLVGIDGEQTGLELEVNYSLDNGASYSTEKIYEYLLHETSTSVDRVGYKNSILLTTPSTLLNCIFKINMRVKNSVSNGYMLGAIKKTILQVTEEVI